MSQKQILNENLDISLPDIFIWRELALIGLILMDISWGVIWVDVLTTFREGVTRFDLFLVIAATVIGGHLLARAMAFLKIRISIQRAAFLLFFFLVTLFGYRTLLDTETGSGVGSLLAQSIESFSDLEILLPAEFVLIIAILFFGYRGIKLTQDFVGPMKVLSHFRLGFLMFFIFGLVFTTLTGQGPGIAWGIFLAAGLLAFASARVAVLALIRGGRKNPFNREWFFGLTLAIGGAIVLSAGIAVFISGIGGILVGLLARLFVTLVLLIMYPIIYLTGYLVLWIFSQFQLEENAISIALQRLSDLLQTLSTNAADFTEIYEALKDLSLRWGPSARLLICSSAVFLIGLIVILQLRKLSRGDHLADLADEDLERSQEGLFDQLVRAIRDNLSNRFGLAGSPKDREKLAAARVRQIYAEMSDLSSELGKPRRIEQTPHEYIPVLSSAFLSLEMEIKQITDAYIRVRYGELPEDQAELEEIEEAWGRVEAFGKRQLKGAEGQSA